MEGHVITCDHAEERESVALSARVSFRDFPTDDSDIEDI